MTAAAFEGVARPHPARHRFVSPGWPVYFVFLSLPFAWLLGLANFALPAYGIVILLGLMLRRRVSLPSGFGLWLLFLAWVAASALELDSGERAIAYAYRASLYLAATALFVYIFSSSEREVPTRLVVKALTVYWAIAVFGGFLGMAFSNVTLPSLAQYLLSPLLPDSVTNVGFVHDITTPGFAEVQRILGFPIGRPKTFFNYTNEWGSVVVLLTPFALIAMRMWNGLWRRAIAVLLFLSLVPLIFSLNRGAWIALIVLVFYASVRFALAGNMRALLAVFATVGVVAVVILATPLGGLIDSRIQTGHSDAGRQTRDLAAIELAKESPVFGYGAPQPAGTDPTAPSVGTHGQAFLLLVSQGIPGLLLFLGCFVYSFLRTASGGSNVRFWCHVTILVFLVQMPFYELTSFQLMIVAAAVALAWREVTASRSLARGEPALASLAAPWQVGSLGSESRLRRPIPHRLPNRLRPQPRPRRPIRARREPSRPRAESADMNLHRRDLSVVARGGALGLVGGLAFGLFGFVLLLVVSQSLGATSAGVFFEAVALFTIISRITQIGADVGVLRATSRLMALGRQQDLVRTVVTAVVPVAAVGALLGVALYVFAPAVSRLIVNGTTTDSLVDYVRIWSPFLVLASLSAVLLAAARGLGSLVPFVSVENIGKPAMQPLLIYVVLALGFGTTAVALSWAVPIAIGFVAAACWLSVLVARAAPARATPAWRTPSRTVFADFWRFASPRAAAAFFAATVAWIDVLLVGALASARAAGIYAAASRLALLGALFLRALILVLGPQVSAFLARDERERAQVVYQVSTWWLTALSWPLYITVAVFAPLVLRIFGPEFATGDTALVVLSLAMLISMACGPVSVVLLMSGKSSWNLYNTIFAAVVGVGLDFVLIPRYGVLGAALAGAAAIAANNLVPLVQVWRSLGLHPLGNGFLIVAGSAWITFGAIGLLGRLLLGTTPLALVASTLVASLAYAFLLRRARGTLNLGVLRDIIRLRGRPAGAAHGATP
jgi:O-antigen/teichoic acid export membrane protein